MSLPIWNSTLDGKYDVEVVPDKDYLGVLIVTHKDTGNLVGKRNVSVSFNAVFGPDTEDIAVWQKIGIEIIDNLKK